MAMEMQREVTKERDITHTCSENLTLEVSNLFCWFSIKDPEKELSQPASHLMWFWPAADSYTVSSSPNITGQVEPLVLAVMEDISIQKQDGLIPGCSLFP